jgi:hypothetical protein
MTHPASLLFQGSAAAHRTGVAQTRPRDRPGLPECRSARNQSFFLSRQQNAVRPSPTLRMHRVRFGLRSRAKQRSISSGRIDRALTTCGPPLTLGGYLPSSFRSVKAVKLRSVIATVGASGAVALQLIANIPPARAADSVQVRGTIVNRDRSMPKVKARDGATTAAEILTGVAKAVLDDVKPCESVGIAPVPRAAEAARSKS